MRTILQKELQGFLDSPIAYVAIAVFLTGMGLFTWVFPETNVLDYGFAEMDPTFNMAPYVYLMLIPAITMRSFAEEKRTGTLELLLTKPITEWDLVLGKFWASVLLVVLSLLPTLIYYFSIYTLGEPKGNVDSAAVAGSYIGLLLLGAVFCSIGLFASAVAESQVTAFILAVALCFLLHSGFSSFAGINVWGPLAPIVTKLGISYHYQALSKGLIDSRNVLYLASVSAAFLAATRLSLQSRNW